VKPGAAITIGSFDGVHVGHAALVRRARERARGPVRALVFDPHPASIRAPERVPGRLSTFAQREAWLREAGADEVIRLDPASGVLDLNPEDFARRLRDEFGAGLVVEGEDFRFGRGRAGTVRTLATLGAELGFEVEVVPGVEVALCDQVLARASSSLVRWLVERGRVPDAARVLSRPYCIEGLVEQGERRGRTLGIPTANLRSAHLLPADGVYACLAELPAGGRHACALSVGTKPHFQGRVRAAEAHLLDVPRAGEAIAGLPEYGWTLRLHLLAFIREQWAFESLGALMDQIGRDLGRTRGVCADVHAGPWPGLPEMQHA
jgi:riboflavin kinase/FMN adenylyltransferase